MRKMMMAIALGATLVSTSAMATKPDPKWTSTGPGKGSGGGFAPGQGPQGDRDHRGPARGRGMMGSPERMFAMIDANRDGSISRAEFDGFHKRMRAMRGRDGDRGPPHGVEGRGPQPKPRG